MTVVCEVASAFEEPPSVWLEHRVYVRGSADWGKDRTGGVHRAQTPVAFVMLRSWDLNVVKIQGERIKGWSEGYMCRCSSDV